MNIVEKIYENKIPENEIFDAKHHSMYCCISYFNSFCKNRPVHYLKLDDIEIYYVVFTSKISILGTLNQYHREEVSKVCTYLFSKYSHKYIDWGGFYEPITLSKYPIHKTAIVSDVYMDLPSTEEDYLVLLNKTTRKHIKYYIRKMKKDYPDLEFKCYRHQEITEELVRQIVLFNHQRMEGKNTKSSLDEDFIINMYKECQDNGIIHTVELNGKLIAATINNEEYKHAHLSTISHDPLFNSYNPGQIALYNTIVDCIKRKCTRFHFLWEIVDYKKRFGGHLVELYYYHIYPNMSLKERKDAIICNANCSIMYFQKRSETGRKIINKVKKILGRK